VRPTYPDIVPTSSRVRDRARVGHVTPERLQAQIVRCACEVCGTHTNAVKTFRVAGSCPNCGSFRLVPVEGAEPLGGAPLAA
jgi:hypothetical protein